MVQRLQAIEDARPRVYGPSAEDVLRRTESGEAGSFDIQYKLALAHMKGGELAEAAAVLEGLAAGLDGEGAASAEVRQRVRYSLVATYLRRAELRNCARNHNYDSCLLPIRGGGVHDDKEGAEQARKALLAILAETPDDLLGRWLLNLCAMVVGDYPDGVPHPYRIDPELFASEAELPRFFDVAPELGIDVNGISGSSCLDDFDADGDIDLVCSSMGLGDSLSYFENRGDGTFEDRSASAGLTGITGGLNVTHADYDNDGLPDLLVLRGAWMGAMGKMPCSLLRNQGNGSFRDVTESAGLLTFFPTQTGVWADLDNDGFLDLFVGSEEEDRRSCLYRNRGDGTFEDVVGGSGIGPLGFVKGACCGDYDNDGLTDLYVSCNGSRNYLFRNLGDFRFQDVTSEADLNEDPSTFACWFFDYDNDGNEDLFAAGYSARFATLDGVSLSDIPAARLGSEIRRDVWPRLYRNRGDGSFEDTTSRVGLDRVVLIMGANFGDIDNDGWLDIYLGTGHSNFLALMANRMFKNDRGARFLDVTTAGGFGHLQKGHGISFADVDNDGDQDIYTVMGGWYPSDNYPNVLYANPGNENRWVTLVLRGRRSNRSAVGARIEVRVETPRGPRSIHRTVGTGGSFGSNSLQLEIGLADARRILFVGVDWPASGRRQVLHGIEMDRAWSIDEGRNGAEPLERTPFPITPRSHGARAAHH